jgi:hypothetical protein
MAARKLSWAIAQRFSALARMRRAAMSALAPLLGMSGSNTASQLEIRFCRQRGDLLRSTECQRTLIHHLAAGPPVLLAGQ